MNAPVIRGATTSFILFAFVASHAVVHVNFDSQVTGDITTFTGGSGYPPNGGMVNIAGIDHRIALTTTNRSGAMLFINETKTVPINLFGIHEVYTIINTGYGVFGQGNGQVEVHGSGGLLQTVPLTQGNNIRDHYNGNYVNVAPNVNGTIYYGSGVRFDQQKIVLNPAFHSAILTEIRFVGQNNGGFNGRPFLQSLTLVQGPTQTVTGTLTLNDTVAAFAAPRTIGYSIVQGTTTVQTGTVVSSASSTPFNIALPAGAVGAAVLSLDGSSFLRESVAITLTGTTINAGTTNMTNGDADMSGEVDAVDIDMVIADFGATNSGNTDADVSGEVDAIDIDICIANFGAIDD